MTQVEKRFDFGSISLPPSLRLDVHISLHFKGCGEAEQRPEEVSDSDVFLQTQQHISGRVSVQIVFGNRNLHLTISVNYTPEKCSCAKNLDSHSVFTPVFTKMLLCVL